MQFVYLSWNLKLISYFVVMLSQTAFKFQTVNAQDLQMAEFYDLMSCFRNGLLLEGVLDCMKGCKSDKHYE